MTFFDVILILFPALILLLIITSAVEKQANPGRSYRYRLVPHNGDEKFYRIERRLSFSSEWDTFSCDKFDHRRYSYYTKEEALTKVDLIRDHEIKWWDEFNEDQKKRKKGIINL